MSAQDSNAEIFDVFLCHNTEDKPAVREIARNLVREGIKPWLDEEQIRPGTSWQTALGQQIKSIKSAAVFVGRSGLGPWQNHEIQALLSQFVKRRCPVIPVILPSAEIAPELPWTLENFKYVDFRASHPDPLEQLIWGITGVRPKEYSQSSNDATTTLEADTGELLPLKQKQMIEVRLTEDLDDQERDRILSLLEIGKFRVTRAIAGNIRLHLELQQEDADRVYIAGQNGQLTALGISEVRLYPGIAASPDGEQRSQLLILLDRVNEIWIDGVLRNSLYSEVLISLGKLPIDEAVEPPWKRVVQLSRQRSQLLLHNRSIATIFNATGLLLILGEPGSGKTTTLLDLAATLLSRAKADAKERVPFVLNLSSWMKKQRLDEWIAVELLEKYGVPVKIAHSWLQNDYVVPLLDGLDEVPLAWQPELVAAINNFLEGFEPSGVVVCCRITEYQWLPKRLKLNGAICLDSLSFEEVDKYLANGGSRLSTLREAIDRDPVLQELLQTPLMLSIMSLACQGDGGSELARQKGNSLEERRRHIFSLYVEEMFKRKGPTPVEFPMEKTIGWLSWLAREMREQSQSAFNVEGLQPSWLGTRADRFVYGTLVALSLGLMFGLIAGFGVWRPFIFMSGSYVINNGLSVGLSILVGIGLGCWSTVPMTNSLKIGWISGIIFGLNYGLIPGVVQAAIVGMIGEFGVGSLNHVTPVATITWKWDRFWKKMAFFGLCGGPVFGWSYGISSGLASGLMIGLASGVIGGWIGESTDRIKVGKASTNQGITLSLKNSFILLLATWSTCLTLGLLFEPLLRGA